MSLTNLSGRVMGRDAIHQLLKGKAPIRNLSVMDLSHCLFDHQDHYVPDPPYPVANTLQSIDTTAGLIDHAHYSATVAHSVHIV